MKRSCNCLIERAASTPEKVNMSGWLAKRTARMELILRPPSLSILGGGMMKHDETVKNWGQTWEIHHWHLLNSIDTGKPRHFGKQLPWSSPCATEVSTSNSPQPIPGLRLLKIQTHFIHGVFFHPPTLSFKKPRRPLTQLQQNIKNLKHVGLSLDGDVTDVTPVTWRLL